MQILPHDNVLIWFNLSPSALNASSIVVTIEGIEHLMRNNFLTWKTKVTVVLDVLDLDYALRMDVPTAPAIGVENYDELKKIYDAIPKKWERSNHFVSNDYQELYISWDKGSNP